MSDRRIGDLVAEMQVKAMQFEARANAAIAPSKVVITTTWRSPAEQEIAHATGHSNAKPGQSPHECELADGTPASRAFDWGVFDPKSGYVIDGRDPRYTTCGAIVKSLDLDWGGDWKHEDWDHAEMRDWRQV